MNDQYKNIPNDKFSGKLRIELYKLAKLSPDILMNSLSEIANCKLSDEAFQILARHTNFQIPTIQIENIELIARINDLKFMQQKDKVSSVKLATEAYIKTYEETKEVDYLIRALQLIKKLKSIFKEQLPEFREYIINEITNLGSSFDKLRLLENSVFLSDDEFKIVLSRKFQEQLVKSFDNHHYTDSKNYIHVLNKLGVFDRTELKIQLSSCFEKEADYYVSQKEPNTYYPNILNLYTDSIKELKGVDIPLEIRNRIEQKIKKEKPLHTEMLRKVGVSLDAKLDITPDILSLDIVDFQTGFAYLIDLPIIESEISINQEKRHNFLDELFSNYVRYTPKATVSGITNSDKFYSNLIRSKFRELYIDIIREIKKMMDFDRLVTKDIVAMMIDKCQSRFIPEDRKHVFIEGVYAGFQNDFITAAHILTPQIENSLKTLIESNDRSVTKFANEIQNDNTLGTILNLEENGKMLHGISDKNLLIELNSFLIDGNSVNFRNELCHGLMTPLSIDYYGIYLWWLVIKLVKQTDQYFNLKV